MYFVLIFTIQDTLLITPKLSFYEIKNCKMLRKIKLINFNSLIHKLYCTVPTEHKKPKVELQENTKQFLNNFSKDIMVNVFNLDLFLFPELTNNVDLDRVNKLIGDLQTITKLFKQEQPEDLMVNINNQLSKSGLFGLCIPELYNGNSYNYMMLCRVMESICNNVHFAQNILIPQILSTQAILSAGTKIHQQIYLTDMGRGAVRMTLAFEEIPCGDIRSEKISTTAHLNNQEQVYILNGEKTVVSNFNDSNFVVLFAKISDRLVGSFIVDTHSPGISSMPCQFNNSLGYDLKLESVRVPVSNFLSEISGLEVARKLAAINNVSIGALCSGLMKSLLKKTNEFVCSRSVFGRPLSKFEVMQFKMVSFTDQVYVAESTTFYTAGLIDKYPDNDFYIESTLTKIICLEALSRSVDSCLKIMGANSLTKADIEFMVIYDNAQKLLTQQIPLLKVKQSVMSEIVPYMISSFNSHKPLKFKIFDRLGFLKTKIFFDKNAIVDSFRYNLHPRVGSLADSIHGDLDELSRFLEKIAVGDEQDILRSDLFLTRLCNILCNIFTIVPVLSRSSRSISIGLRNQDQEVNLTEFHATQIIQEVKKQIQELKEYNKKSSLVNETAKIITEMKGNFEFS